MKTFFKSLVLLLSVIFSHQVLANTYTVTTTADSGPGSLRQAIIDANSNPGADIIVFNIAAGGNLFEGVSPYTYAVIELNSALPAITEALTIDGTSQADTNTDSTSTYSVGVDGVNLGRIAFPDVYIVPSATFSFPVNSNGISGNGLTVDATNVTITGLAISGFGNTHTNGGTASGHADISVLRSPVARTANISITNCFISCDPTGILPALAHRKTKGNGILVAGNNQTGSISNNYIAYSGTYGLHFNGNTDNNNVGPANTTLGNRNWTISGNRVVNVTINTTINAITKVNDAITLMKCAGFDVINNYITNPEQMGIDIGYNSDSNYIANNTITGFVKTSAFQLQAGIRIGLSSEADTITKNVIYNNTSSTFKAGVWLDRSTLTQTGIITKNNFNHLISENRICYNNGSGIVLSTTGSGECYDNTITRNSIYDNNGLGIDLNFAGTTGTPTVSSNDDEDLDNGPNLVQNFPILDSVRQWSGNRLAFYGKAPAGSILEFFVSDGAINKHGGASLNYGEGKTFIGSAIEGSADDLASGITAYNVDGNAESKSNLFAIVLTYNGTITTLDSITTTATVGKNTSEFGPVVQVQVPLAVDLFGFSASYDDDKVKLNWEAASDNDFLHFVVEHSIDGSRFSSIGMVYPKGIETIHSYDFIHFKVAAESNFYRLRMVNGTGRTTYSSIIHIKAKQVNEDVMVSGYFKNRIELEIRNNIEEETGLHLFNSSGKLVKYSQTRLNKGKNFTSIDNLETLAPGVYILVIRNGSQNISKKIIKL